MKWQRIALLILFSPILIPVVMIGLIVMGFVFGIEYALTGKYNQDDGGW